MPTDGVALSVITVRVALYGIDWLIAAKIQEKAGLNPDDIDSPAIRLLEELSDQIRALASMKVMAAEYGYDICRPPQLWKPCSGRTPIWLR